MRRELANGNLIRIVGMSRSGNHAIINWMLAQLTGRWCFLNCIERKSNPFHTARPLHGDRCYETNDPHFDYDAHQDGRLSPKDHLLFSQEDTFLGPALGPEATAIHTAAVGSCKRRLDVLILRDPYNLFASRRRLGHQEITDRIMLRMWKQHARAFLGERRYLAGPTVGISYNAWVRDPDYRRQIAEALGLVFTDAGLNRIARCGGGSSFDGLRFDGRAGRMSVFDRWRSYWGEPDFRRLFDPEVRFLSRQIFGLLPDDVVDAGRQDTTMRHIPPLSLHGQCTEA